MIPTLIVLGFIFGRWWRLSLAVAAVGWPAVLVASGVAELEAGLVGAAGLAVLNTGVGVLVHQAVRWAVRSVRNRQRADASANT
ncbi:MAG TPA: hypothetical protein VFR23_06740 [Jiangellaceae bacterium]|nr:hypothetical protein [Jiangellaceae bacterium]